VYNPVSMAKALSIYRNPEGYSEELFVHKELWRDWNCHSSLADSEYSVANSRRHTAITAGARAWKSSNILFLSLGSAFAWRRKQSGSIVANCHQFPAKEFQRQLLEIDEMKECLGSELQYFLQERSNATVLVTVSPVRYLRDGLIQSKRSKARLLELAHQLSEDFEQVEYFPAYEIVTDQLREYRFFKEDRVHPSTEAVNFVWKQLCEYFCDSKTKSFIQEAERIQKLFAHRVVKPHSRQGQQFIQYREEQRKDFHQRFGLSHF